MHSAITQQPSTIFVLGGARCCCRRRGSASRGPALRSAANGRAEYLTLVAAVLPVMHVCIPMPTRNAPNAYGSLMLVRQSVGRPVGRSGGSIIARSGAVVIFTIGCSGVIFQSRSAEQPISMTAQQIPLQIKHEAVTLAAPESKPPGGFHFLIQFGDS